MREVVLVLGAGASVDFGLPTGHALSDQIARLLNFEFDTFGQRVSGDPGILRLISNRNNTSALVNACQKLARALPFSHSIDDALYKFGDDRALIEIGKVAIGHCIMIAESKSWLLKLTANPINARKSLLSAKEHWLFRVLKAIQTNRRSSELLSAFEGLSIINFNYDRCVEHFLVHALQPAFGIDENDAARAIAGLTMVHPYGSVGALPWQQSPAYSVPFGNEPRQENLRKVGERIRTFTEQQAGGEEASAIKKLIGSAQCVVFLGFGYHAQNMILLGGGVRGEGPHVVGTTYGSSEPDIQVFAERVRANFSRLRNPELVDSKSDCARFMQDHALSLFG